jgi:CubicO group peptidase (beta-lactamase class C family)
MLQRKDMQPDRRNTSGRLGGLVHVALWAGLLLGCASSIPRPEPIARGDYDAVRRYATALIRDEIDSEGIAGMSIALVDDQKIVWAEGFGYADREASVPASADTVYRVGSITKLFTATAAMQLAEAGKIDIDQPVSAVLPGFSMRSRFPGTGPVTPRLLMTHHSGLPSDILHGFTQAHPASLAETAEELKDGWLAYPPGQLWSYSNVGFSLLGRIVEVAAGEPYAQHLDAALFRPLGMEHTWISSEISTRPGSAKGYRNGHEADDFILRDVPAGGMNSTVRDLSRFLSMVFADGQAGGRQIIRPETLHEMLRVQNAGNPLDLTYQIGLAWAIGPVGDLVLPDGELIAQHTGGTITFHSQLIALPKSKLGIVVLSNSQAARTVVGKVAHAVLKAAYEAKTGIRPPERGERSADRHPLSPELKRAWEGEYATGLGYARVYRSGSEQMRAEFMGWTFEATERERGILGLRFLLLGLVPINPGELGQLGLLRTDVGGHELIGASFGPQRLVVGEKIEPVPIPKAWLDRVGPYEVSESEKSGFFVPKALTTDGRYLYLNLEVKHTVIPNSTLKLPLQPISDDAAVVRGLGRGLGEVIVAVREGKSVRIKYSGYLMRREGEPEPAAVVHAAAPGGAGVKSGL